VGDGLSYTERLRLYSGRRERFAPPPRDAHAHAEKTVTFVTYNPAKRPAGDGAPCPM